MLGQATEFQFRRRTSAGGMAQDRRLKTEDQTDAVEL